MKKNMQNALLDEERSTCDECEHLRKCIDEGIAVNITLITNLTRHYTPLGGFCPLIFDLTRGESK